jgi:deoxyribose-phosphate aldolase
MNKQQQIEDSIQQIILKNGKIISLDNLKRIFSLIDLTSLNTGDNERRIIEICNKINSFKEHFKEMPNVAAFCVYPNFVATISNHLKDKAVKIVSVAGGFPSSQTYFEIKKREVEKALLDGADEIDIVLPVGKILDHKETEVSRELQELKRLTGPKHLKVILETGLLNDYELIHNAGMLAMESGADFIKTSTGKLEPAATLEAVYIMANSIKLYYKSTGKKTGIKPAGGISTSVQAHNYLLIIKEVLGEEWLNSGLFRIGASRLANNLLTDINENGNGEKQQVQYF